MSLPIKRLITVASSLCILVVVLSATLYRSQSTYAANPASWKPLIYHQSTNVSAAQAASLKLKHWSSSFSFGGKTYPYTMLGTNPASGSATTTFTVKIVPLKMVFSNGIVIDGSKQVTNTTNSPVFKPVSFLSGTTQFGDAMQRAEFWQTVSTKSPNYHVLLGTPTIAPVTTLNVPAADGIAGQNSKGQTFGLVDFTWMENALFPLLSKNNINTGMLPIFLSGNVFLYVNGNPNDCCLFGYHAVITTTLQTYIWASNSAPGASTIAGLQDVYVLSHEVAEWMNDPVNGNTVPNWNIPSQPQNGCFNKLEVGDPLTGTFYTKSVGGKTYHLTDVAFFSWFARQSPSIGINGQYTYAKTFTTFSPSC